MLIGQYEAILGAKKRIAFPKKFRDTMGDALILTYGFEHSILIVSESGWKALLEGTEGKPFVQREIRETQRFLLGGASELKLDSKGRFVVPTYLCNFGKLIKNVIFVGVSRYVEMWDKKSWEEHTKNLEKNIEVIAQNIIKEDLRGN